MVCFSDPLEDSLPISISFVVFLVLYDLWQNIRVKTRIPRLKIECCIFYLNHVDIRDTAFLSFDKMKCKRRKTGVIP
jgi:hypothetical protein